LKDRTFFRKMRTSVREEGTILFRGPAESGYAVLLQKRVQAAPAKPGHSAGLLHIAPGEFNEILVPRERYALIDYDGLRGLLGFRSMVDLAEAYRGWVDQSLQEENHRRDGKWTAGRYRLNINMMARSDPDLIPDSMSAPKSLSISAIILPS
jgi:hypothetical protein